MDILAKAEFIMAHYPVMWGLGASMFGVCLGMSIFYYLNCIVLNKKIITLLRKGSYHRE